MANSLEVLAENRDALLLAEVAAWLHMFGKLSEEFLSGKTQFSRIIPPLVRTAFPELNTLLKENWTGNIWDSLPLGQMIGTNTKSLTISQIIGTHERPIDNYQEGLRKFLIDAHGHGSGSEKGKLNRFTVPHTDPVFLSTVLGYETAISVPSIQAMQLRLYKFLQIDLLDIKSKNGKLSDWVERRSKFNQLMKQCFSITVAENRRPLNDISLFDQTAMSVACLKAALAQTVLNEQSTSAKGKKIKQNNASYRYNVRLLRVGIDSFAFWGNSTRINDLQARYELIQNALNAIKELLEVTYPLGFEVYRDENGSVFIIPDLEEILLYKDNQITLKEILQEESRKELSDEATLTILNPSDPMRMTLSLKSQVNISLPHPSPVPTWVTQQWQGKQGNICFVCNLRPQGLQGKALERKVCDICETRRSKRAGNWMKNLTDTIWLDEVADKQGILALIVGQFNIFDWLTGKTLSTIPIIDPHPSTLFDRDQSYQFDLEVMTDEFRQGLIANQEFQELSMVSNLIVEDLRGTDSVRGFYELQVMKTDLRPSLSEYEPDLLTLSLSRRSPSPARIYRTWRTTQAFWGSIVSNFKTEVNEASQRLRIQGEFTPYGGNRATLGITHTYDLKLDNTNLSIVCDTDRKYITVDNLCRVALLLGASKKEHEDDSKSAYYVQDRLYGKQVVVEEQTGYGGPSKVLGTLQITDVQVDETAYTPAIPILTEPRTFMALVPADKALAVVDSIKEKYETEMGKVRNRLPLTLGVVFAGSRTPLPAILDAGRRMLRQPTGSEIWEVKNVDKVDISEWPIQVSLTLIQGERTIKVVVPTIMGDQITEDVWYPYWCLENEAPNTPVRARKFKGIDGKLWVHVTDLHVGDEVSYMPSHFDFEFLDTAARRFEVSYADDRRRGIMRSARPYCLEQRKDFEDLWKILSTGLYTSQIDTLVSLIETKRKEWALERKHDSSIFAQMVRDIINTAHWQEGKHPARNDNEDVLCKAAINGQLADVVELYMHILKKKTEVDQKGEKQ